MGNDVHFHTTSVVERQPCIRFLQTAETDLSRACLGGIIDLVCRHADTTRKERHNRVAIPNGIENFIVEGVLHGAFERDWGTGLARDRGGVLLITVRYLSSPMSFGQKVPSNSVCDFIAV